MGPQFDSWVGKICWKRDRLPSPVFLVFPCDSAGKESTCNVGDLGSIPALGRSPREGNCYPLQYSKLNLVGAIITCEIKVLNVLENNSLIEVIFYT